MSGLPENVTYTKIPNFMIESLMADLKGSEFKIAMAICRKTYGFHKCSDRIPISQIRVLTGLGKNTIIKSIRNLVKARIIEKHDDAIPHKYSIVIKEPECKNDTEGSKNELLTVSKEDRVSVQKLPPQKKPIKQTEINTTNSSTVVSDEVIEIARYWKELFDTQINLSNKEIVYAIQKRIYSFGIDTIKKAMINRSKSSYYKEQKPYLRSSASAFFPYPSTIANDLNRSPKDIFTYEERNERIYKGFNVDEDFEIFPDQRDEQGRPKWKLRC